LDLDETDAEALRRCGFLDPYFQLFEVPDGFTQSYELVNPNFHYSVSLYRRLCEEAAGIEQDEENVMQQPFTSSSSCSIPAASSHNRRYRLTL
jgi:hypothetical protein